MSNNQDAELNIMLIEGVLLSHWSPTIRDWLLISQNMTWEALPDQVHQQFANIVIRRQLELASLASTLTKTQETLGMERTARQQQMGLLHIQLARFLLHLAAQ